MPYAISAVLMIFWGRSSDRSGERVWHNALPLGWMALAMVATFFAHSLWALLPADPNNPPPKVIAQLDQDRYYRLLTYLTVP